MKKILSLILALSIFIACFNLGIAFVNAGQTSLPEDMQINLLDDKASTFEGGTTSWIAFSKGTVKVVNNPLGEGKVLQYTHTGENTYQSPAFNLRHYVSQPGRIYISFDVYSPNKDINASFCVRTNTANILSACTSTDGKRGALFSSTDYINNKETKSNAVKATSGAWHRFEFVIDVTQADIDNTSTDGWTICFDGLKASNGTGFGADDVVYIDNVVACYSDHVVAEKTGIVRDNYTKVGAIRWDAFTQSGEIPEGADVANYVPASQVANVLSPAKYHYYAPFFANITDDGKIAFPEYTMETWEKEALYAHDAGLDYFSYLWYETTSDMSIPRKLHLQSENKNLMQMTGILETIRSAQTMFELFNAMKDPCWLRLSGRPVLFLYDVRGERWTLEKVQAIRQMAYRAGVTESLYIIGMSTDYENFDTVIYDRDMDAVSMYSYSALAQGEPYDNYVNRLEELEKAMINAATNADHQVVPIFSMGRDGRPRIDTKVSWIDGDPDAALDSQKPYGNKYTLKTDMATVKDHIANIYNLTQNNPDVTMPNLICSYAWNEHDEGGWLCPTLNCDENGNLITSDPINTERLDTLKGALDALREGSHIAKPTQDPNSIKTVYNGDAESGIQNWGNIHGGSFGYIQPGANGTNNAIRFIPAATTNVNNSIAFNIAPAILNDGDYNFAGCGAGYYNITFWAKAKDIPTGSSAKFTVGIDSANHIAANIVSQYTDYSIYNTFISGADGVASAITMTEQWQQYSVTIKVEEDWLKMLKQLRESNHSGAAKTYNVVLRLDGAGSSNAFGSVSTTFEYYIDELTVTHATSLNGIYSKLYPTPTPVPAMPTATPAPTAIPQSSVKDYLDYDIIDGGIKITDSKMDIHGDIIIPNVIEGLPVIEIGEGAFRYRAQITKVTLPDTVTKIGDFAFEKCINLNTIVLNNKLSFIGAHAFCGCDELENGVALPRSIQTVESFAFHNCNKLTNAQYLGSYKSFSGRVNVQEYNESLLNVLTFKANSIEGASLNIGSSLNIDYYAYLEADPTKVTMHFTNANGKVYTAQGTYDSKYDLYKFTYIGVNPQCMTDNVKAELVLDDGTVLDVKEEYSVKQYCDSIMQQSNEELRKQTPNANLLKRLMADMLIYGAEAQYDQDYKVDNLASDSDWVNDYASKKFIKPTGVKNITGNLDEQNKVKAAGLSMANFNKIYFRLVLTDKDVKVLLNGVEVSSEDIIRYPDNIRVVYTHGLKATEFDKVFTLELVKGNEVISKVEYNVNAYIEAKYNSETVGSIVKAFNNYGVSAVKYLDLLNGKYDDDFDLDDEDDLAGDIIADKVYENLIPAISSDFDSATTVDDTAWVKGSGVSNIGEVGLADDGKGGKCIYYTRNGIATVNFDTIALDISKYIKEEGEYTITFRYKVTGDCAGESPFGGVIRTSSATSFATSGGGTYGGLGEAKAVTSGVWADYAATLFVKSTDIGVGGKWNLCLHTINAAVTEIYLDDVVVKQVDYDSMKKDVESAQTWVANEAVFISDKWYEDAYHDVTMDLILTNGHVTYTIPCFWDGGKVWRARFVCPSAGTWTYTTTCYNTSDAGLNNQEGKFECSEYSGDYDIYKHGFVTSKYNNATRQKYFTYADGTPFFYLGDTHWNFDREPIDAFKTIVNKRTQQGFTVYQSEAGSNSVIFQNGFTSADLIKIKNLDEKFQYIAQNGLVHAHSQFFFPDQMDNFINYYGQLYGNEPVLVTDADGNPVKSSLNNVEQEIYIYGVDPNKHVGTETVSVRQAYIDSEGKLQKDDKTKDLNIQLKLYDYTDEVKAELKHMARYWVARYSAYPVMWTLGQEVDDDFMFSTGSDPSLKVDDPLTEKDEAETEKTVIGFGHPMWGGANNPYKLVAQYISDLDPYNSPLTAHQETASRNRVSTSGFNNIFNSANKEVHTWYASQFKTPFNFGGLYRKADYNADINVTYERAQEYWNSNKVAVNYEGYYDRLQTKDFGARAQGWMAYLNGMFGYGWGAQGTWQYNGSYGDNWTGDHVTDGVDDIYITERIEENDWQKALKRNSAEQMGYMRKFFTTTVGDWYNLTPRFSNTNFLERETGAYAFLASNSDNSKVVVYFCNFTDTNIAEFANSTNGTATGKLRALQTNTTYNYMWLNPITGAVEETGTFYSENYGTWTIGAKSNSDMVLYVYL